MGTRNWRDARITTKACLLRAGAIPLDKLPQRQVAEGFEGSHTPYTLAWSWNARALLAYRNGDAKQALEYLNESDKNQPVTYAKALGYPLSALIHHKLGNEQQAAEALASAESLLKQLSGSESDKYHHDVLIAGILFAEAEKELSGE